MEIWTFSFVADLLYSVANSAVLQMCCSAAPAWGVSGRQDVLRYRVVLTASVEALPSVHLPVDLLDLLPCSDQCCTSFKRKASHKETLYPGRVVLWSW